VGTLTYGLGKGLQEPVSPFRKAYFFGAPLNSQSAYNWKAVPTIIEPTTSFDLSQLSLNSEVVVALVGVTGYNGGVTQIGWTWYRDADNKLLYSLLWSWDFPSGWQVYAYTYIGYLAPEIIQNGAYHVNIVATGAETFNITLPFVVLGISVVVEPPPPHPLAVTFIVELLNRASTFFYSIYQTVLGWVWPFNQAAGLFYSLCIMFVDLAGAFATFNDWVVDTTAKIANVLNLDSLEAWFVDWRARILTAWNWVLTSLANVTSIIENWWLATRATVQGWISTATEGFAGLRSQWDNFWTVTFPTLVSFQWLSTWWSGRLVDIDTLVNSRLRVWFPFYDELVSLWSSIRSFFVDPLQWVYDRLDDFFERFW
jgi:hypothetical protein